jgi:hypothetical protein
MEGPALPLDTIPGRRKSVFWDRMKRKNASSPSLHRVGIKNWSTRSLPRLGSFGSLSPGIGHSRKSSAASTPTSLTFDAPEISTPKKQRVVKDYFSGLPNEVQLQILSYLPVKTIAKASRVLSIAMFLTVGLSAMADVV